MPPWTIENRPKPPRLSSSPIVWRWWDRESLTAAAAISAVVAGLLLLTPGDTGPDYKYLWVAGLLLIASGLGIRAGRLRADAPSRLDIAASFLSNWLTWRVASIAAGSFLLLLVVFGINQPWSPLQPCTRVELSARYTDHKCLARVLRGQVVSWDRGEGEAVVRDSGTLNDVDFSLVEPTLDTYHWQYRPLTGWLLSVFAIGGFVLSAWLRSAQKQREALASAHVQLDEARARESERKEKRRKRD